jgi:hypothetical protein
MSMSAWQKVLTLVPRELFQPLRGTMMTYLIVLWLVKDK